MLAAVALLMLPVVLVLSVMRLVQLPRDLWAGRAVISPRRRMLSAPGFGVLYCALASYTLVALLEAARALWTPPRTIHELFAVAVVAVAYPLVHLAFEWVLHYSVERPPRA